MPDLSKYGLSSVEFPKVCVRIGNSNFAEVSLNELPTIADVLIRFGFMFTVHKIND